MKLDGDGGAVALLPKQERRRRRSRAEGRLLVVEAVA
jgi:hypothetical protein